jgi:hypothetical protein
MSKAVVPSAAVLAAIAIGAGFSTPAVAGGAEPVRVDVDIQCTPLEEFFKRASFNVEGDGGDGKAPPWSINKITGVLQVSVSNGPVGTGFSVRKGQLTNAQAFGQGRPNGETGLPYAGPYVGAMWPYRDIADFNYSPTSPNVNGNNIGTIVQTSPGVFRVGNAAGTGADTMVTPMTLQAFGGPTESPTSGRPLSPLRYDRGIPGNGFRSLDSTGGRGADFFALDIGYLDGFQRTVDVAFLSGTADVVIKDLASDSYRIITVPIPDVRVTWVIPAPGAAAALALGAFACARRRR